jgi:PTS system beta-glucosides-specific IIC component
MCGMHLVLLVPSFVRLAESGYDNFVLAASAITGFATYGVLIGGFLKAKRKETKTQIGTYFIANVLGGVGEPALYGFMLKYKKPMLAQIIAGFAGGLVGGICGIACYQLVPVMNFLNFLCFAGGNGKNIACAAIACAVAVVVGCVVTMVLGFDEEAE